MEMIKNSTFGHPRKAMRSTDRARDNLTRTSVLTLFDGVEHQSAEQFGIKIGTFGGHALVVFAN